MSATARRTISQGSSTDKSPARLELLHATAAAAGGGRGSSDCNCNCNRKTHILQRSFGYKQLWKRVQTNNRN
ncbi:uncharacterized protein Dvir_GJ26666 [Drosophila virilis]|uniref:Uncharacterized protein n=1 Tax=Drosophila virilis TaxID=7244 RepID=A0A0Q9VZA2_DROVI|nr:uncharacterized protein Dvir_GJ26666 [Drosophila virilis]